MIDRLRHYRDTAKLVRIQRRQIDTENLYGYILDYSDDLVLIARAEDFILNGWAVLDRRYLSDIRSTRSNAYCRKIMVAEGLLDKLAPGFPVDLSCYRGVFRSLRHQGHFVTVERESLEDHDEVFLIGPVARITLKRVAIRYFDPCGKWDDVESIDYADITAVQFGDRYTSLHQKYIDVFAR